MFQPCGLVGIDFVGDGGILHLAQIDDAVATVKHQVDLGAVSFAALGGAPCIRTCTHAGNAERLLDRLDVLEADTFKRKASPCREPRR